MNKSCVSSPSSYSSNHPVTSSSFSSSSSSSASSICKQLVNGHQTPSIDSLMESALDPPLMEDRKSSGVIAIRNAKQQHSTSPIENSTDTLIAGASSYGSSCNSHTFVFPSFDTTPEPELPTSPPPNTSSLANNRPSPAVVPSSVRQRASQFDPVDGLTVLRDEAQSRIEQMVTDFRARELELEREVYSLRMKLLEQFHQDSSAPYNNNNNQGGNNAGTSSDKPEDEGSVCSTEISWEAVEEREAQPTLWVPDHAVTRCMQCDSQFWLGRRKHHCRSCGKIFCADCSENVVALPCEQLYEPVRVCQTCYHHTPPSRTPPPSLQDTAGSASPSSITLQQPTLSNGYHPTTTTTLLSPSQTANDDDPASSSLNSISSNTLVSELDSTTTATTVADSLTPNASSRSDVSSSSTSMASNLPLNGSSPSLTTVTSSTTGLSTTSTMTSISDCLRSTPHLTNGYSSSSSSTTTMATGSTSNPLKSAASCKQAAAEEEKMSSLSLPSTSTS